MKTVSGMEACRVLKRSNLLACSGAMLKSLAAWNVRGIVSRFSFIILLFSLSFHAAAKIYFIQHGGIADHSDGFVTGSIANYFYKHGENNTYVLNSDANYYLDKKIVVPADSVLIGNFFIDISPSIRANPSTWITPGGGQGTTTTIFKDAMIEMKSGSKIMFLTLHGMRAVHIIVKAANVENITIEYTTISGVMNDYISTPAVNPNLSLIVVSDSNWIHINHNLLRYAGYDPHHGGKVNGNSWPGSGSLIHAVRNTNLVIHDNDLAYALSAGVAFQGTLGASIQRNIIQQTGLNRRYADGSGIEFPCGDGLTAYSNDQGVDSNYYLIRNVIRDYLNHGIHVSGKDILIQENRIYGGFGNGIRISDRFGMDCSGNIVIRWNEIDGGSVYGASAIQVLDYEPGTLEIHDNTEYDSTAPVVPTIDQPCDESSPD
jgi:hypothetical protein